MENKIKLKLFRQQNLLIYFIFPINKYILNFRA